MTINSDKIVLELQNQIAAYAQTNCMTQADILAGFTTNGGTTPSSINFVARFNGVNYPMNNAAVLNQITGFMAGMSPNLFPTAPSISCDPGTSPLTCQNTLTCTISVTEAITPVVTPITDCSITGADLTSDGTNCIILSGASFLFIDLS